jgi:hypothetical protein
MNDGIRPMFGGRPEQKSSICQIPLKKSRPRINRGTMPFA